MPRWELKWLPFAEAALLAIPYEIAQALASRIEGIARGEDLYVSLDDRTWCRLRMKNYRARLEFDHEARVITVLYVVRVER